LVLKGDSPGNSSGGNRNGILKNLDGARGLANSKRMARGECSIKSRKQGLVIKKWEEVPKEKRGKNEAK